MVAGIGAVVIMAAAADAASAAQPQGCSIMSITKLHADHPLTKAGLEHVRVVRRLEVGAKPGDVVFQFPHGRMVVEATAGGQPKMPRRENAIPAGVNNALVWQEAKMIGYRERDAERKGKGCAQ